LLRRPPLPILDRLMSAERVDDLLRRLPVRPLVAMRVLESADDPEASLSAMSAVVAMDPGLSTRVLRLANSAAHAGREATTSVERGVMLLGASTVRAMVAAAAFPLFQEDVDLGPDGFWAHALGVAAGAAAAASALGVSSDEAFTVGLLHDIGGAVMHYSDAGAYTALHRNSDPTSRLPRERRAFGADHAQLGAEAVTRWGFPASLVEAIKNHHGAPRAVSRLTLAVMVGEAVAARLDDAQPREPVPDLARLLAETRVTLRPETLMRDTQRRYDRLVALAERTG